MLRGRTGNEEVLEDEIAARRSARVEFGARRRAHVPRQKLKERHERRVVELHESEVHAARRSLTPAQSAVDTHMSFENLLRCFSSQRSEHSENSVGLRSLRTPREQSARTLHAVRVFGGALLLYAAQLEDLLRAPAAALRFRADQIREFTTGYTVLSRLFRVLFSSHPKTVLSASIIACVVCSVEVPSPSSCSAQRWSSSSVRRTACSARAAGRRQCAGPRAPPA